MGILPDSSYNFIDMELCDMSLHEYIYADSDDAVPASQAPPLKFRRDVPSPSKAIQIWQVMKQIADGVTFIHAHNEVHRDLKPKNSIVALSQNANLSSLFMQTFPLEASRFWDHLARDFETGSHD